MIIDARGVPSGTVLNADVCIIGGGPAAISMAREFDGQPFRVILLEGGRFNRDRAGQALYKGENIGLHYEDLDQARSRYFGGSSNCWGGFCRPLDTQDFEIRDWVPNSGWPIRRHDLIPYYKRAHTLLQLGPFEYDPSTWEQWIGRRDARLLQFDADRTTNVVSQLSPPTRFGQRYRNDITWSCNVFTYLNATVTEIIAPETGATVTKVQVRTLAGGAFQVAARTFILATGGIETPRLLLASNRYQAAGVGNQHDLVGRFFMDHPRLRCGEIVFNDPVANSGLYDLHVTLPGEFTAQGVKLSVHFGLTPEAQQAERVSNTRCYVVSRYVGDNPRSYTAIKHLRQALHGGGSLFGRSAADFINLARQLPNVSVLAAGLKLKLPFLARGFALETVVEPTPLPDSRVTLGTERDAVGVPRVRVDWRLGELEKHTIRRTQEILGEEMLRIGAGRVVVDAPRPGDAWPDTLNGCWHHMGTTRMHDNPRNGVVNADCRVHGIENLFIAGSSVFPTCGSDMPTTTIVALALRLADHIKGQYLDKPICNNVPQDLSEMPSAG